MNYSYGNWNGTSIDETKNNGNLVQQVIKVPGMGTEPGFTATQKYYYDSLNRIDDASEDTLPDGGSSTQSWRQDFAYDRYGNRNFVEANTSFAGFDKLCNSNTELCADLRKKLNPAINTSDNRLSSGQGYSFDNAGNTTRDAHDRKFTYDAENKQVKVESLSPGTNTVTGTIGEYFYDGDGRRVKKVVPKPDPEPDEVTIFVYDAAGKLIAEYSTVIETTNAKVAYLTNDHLGSPRINSDANGTVTARHDYHPFGEEIGSSQRTADLGYADDTVRQQFTSHERDKESMLLFVQARYYSRNLGKFLSVDPLRTSAHQADPQSWNRYTYTLNRPTVAVDPDGLSTIVVTVRSNGRDKPTATVRMIRKDGTYRGYSISGLAAGVGGRDRTKTNSDTPFGVYKVNAIPTEGGEIVSRLGKAYGTGKVRFDAVAGEVKDSGRDLIRIHGGGSSLKDPYALDQELKPTHGCVKVTNRDVNNLIGWTKELAGENDSLFRVFIGDEKYLTDLANQKDMNGQYLYPELRVELGLFENEEEKLRLLSSYDEMLENEHRSQQARQR